jgi:RecA/RadA recombinase
VLDLEDALCAVAQEENAKHGLEIVRPGKEETLSDVKGWIPSRSFSLNAILGGPGLPLGKQIELSGEPGEGKTTIVTDLMCAVQEMGGVSILIDSEAKWPRGRAMRMGHTPGSHIQLEPKSIEQAFEIVVSTITNLRSKPALYRDLAKEYEKDGKPGDLLKKMYTGKPVKWANKTTAKTIIADLRALAAKVEQMPILVVYDTISAHAAQTELEGEMFAAGMAVKSRNIRNALRRITQWLPEVKASIVYVAQTMDTLASYGPRTKSATGGKGVKFHAVTRLSIKKKEDFTEAGRVVGIVSEVKAVKSQMCAPGVPVRVYIRSLTGIDGVHELLTILVDSTAKRKESERPIVKKGAWFTVQVGPKSEHKKYNGWSALVAAADQHPELLTIAREQAKQVYAYLGTEAKEGDL